LVEQAIFTLLQLPLEQVWLPAQVCKRFPWFPQESNQYTELPWHLWEALGVQVEFTMTEHEVLWV
jgi:hypothetical protein